LYSRAKTNIKGLKGKIQFEIQYGRGAEEGTANGIILILCSELQTVTCNPKQKQKQKKKKKDDYITGCTQHCVLFSIYTGTNIQLQN
jgi:hypothetical protein